LDRYKRIGTQIEGALFGLIEYAVDSENKLTNKDFKKWLKKHRSKITSLESDMKEYSEDILLKKGYIKRQGKPGYFKHKNSIRILSKRRNLKRMYTNFIII